MIRDALYLAACTVLARFGAATPLLCELSLVAVIA